MGLTWSHSGFVNEQTSKEKPDWSLVPSWSWACLDQTVQWYWSDTWIYHYGPGAPSTDPLGRIITIDGPLLRYQGCLIGFRLTDTVSINIDKIGKGQMSVGEIGHGWFQFEFDWWFLNQHTSSADITPQSQTLLEIVSFMPTLAVGDAATSCPGEDDPFHIGMGTMGVLLVRDRDQVRGIYRRVGTAYTWTELSRIQQNRTITGDGFYYADFAPQDYEDCDGAGLFTVGIM
jgi:hypothetical protein